MRKQIALMLLGAALAAAGCAKTVNTSERANPIGTPTYVQDKRILTDSDVVKILSVQEGQAGDLLKIQVNVLNDRSKTGTFNYMFEWYDLQGMQVSTPTSIWSSIALEGKETKSIIGIAPNPRVKDFKLKLQESKS